MAGAGGLRAEADPFFGPHRRRPAGRQRAEPGRSGRHIPCPRPAAQRIRAGRADRPPQRAGAPGARLLAEGLTNRQIGQRLYLAEMTVKNYVTSVLSKTGKPGAPRPRCTPPVTSTRRSTDAVRSGRRLWPRRSSLASTGRLEIDRAEPGADQGSGSPPAGDRRPGSPCLGVPSAILPLHFTLDRDRTIVSTWGRQHPGERYSWPGCGVRESKGRRRRPPSIECAGQRDGRPRRRQGPRRARAVSARPARHARHRSRPILRRDGDHPTAGRMQSWPIRRRRVRRRSDRPPNEIGPGSGWLERSR